MRSKLSPQLTALLKHPPTGDAWIYEAKLDGYRILARIESGDVRLITRNGNDWTAKMPALAKEIGTLDLRSAWFDGEIVVMRPDGVPDFNALQNAMDASKGSAVVYFVFDLPYANGYDLTRSPLYARRELLRQVMQKHKGNRVKFSDDFPGADGETMLKAACKMGLEGIIAKRKDAPYISTRAPTWVKVKCTMRQEFVVIGFVDRAGSNKSEVGSLLLGYYDYGELRYAGSCGAGWDMRTEADLHKRLTKIEIHKSALDRGEMKPGRWSKRKPGGRAVGEARDGRRDRVHRLDAGRSRAASVLPRRARPWSFLDLKTRIALDMNSANEQNVAGFAGNATQHPACQFSLYSK